GAVHLDRGHQQARFRRQLLYGHRAAQRIHLSRLERNGDRPRPVVHVRHGGGISAVHHRGAGQMILVAIIVILLIAGLLAWISSRWSTELPRWISLAAAVVDLLLTGRIWFATASSGPHEWLEQGKWSGVTGIGRQFRLGIDGLVVLKVMLRLSRGISW